MLIAGGAVKQGTYGVREMIDLAPTLAHLLGVARPAGAEGCVIPLGRD
ncbi:MAG: hypothetical protein ACREYF_01620 [Gammaproteobacteria bacterium]